MKDFFRENAVIILTIILVIVIIIVTGSAVYSMLIVPALLKKSGEIKQKEKEIDNNKKDAISQYDINKELEEKYDNSKIDASVIINDIEKEVDDMDTDEITNNAIEIMKKKGII